jgi:hypothetical protein
MSKRQGTIESSVFGAEFVAMKVGLEAARGLRYKLRMMGIQVNDPVYILGDNMSVIHNTSKPESVLKKKSSDFWHNTQPLYRKLETDGVLILYITGYQYGILKRCNVDLTVKHSQD